MFFTFGSPESIRSIKIPIQDIAQSRSALEIAVLDDNKFEPQEFLSRHKFRINELGPDIRSIDQVANFPIIVCDVKGVGRSFGSRLEGAHVVNEIRKFYPDKFIIGYTGETHSIETSNALAVADKRMEKDAQLEAWIKNLDHGIKEVIDPYNRWRRIRNALFEREVETIEVLKLEQSYIESIRQKNPENLKSKAKKLKLPSEVTELMINFAATAVVELIRN